MLADGFSSRRGRRGALIHYDGVNRLLRAARVTADRADLWRDHPG